MPDEVERAVVGVEAEQQRRDPAVGLVAPAEADDHAVRRLVRLHLDHAVARAGQVRQPEPLGDHAVEPRLLEAVEPARCLLRIVGRGREPELLRLLLELAPALLQRQLVDRLALPDEQVEGDVVRRDLGREPLDPALRGMEPQLQLVELEPPLARDDDLAVERRVRRQERADLLELGEVAQQRPPVARPEPQPAAEVLEHAAEAVPLRLVLPVAGRQLLDELGLHRREGKVSRRHRGTTLSPWPSSTEPGTCGGPAACCRRSSECASTSTGRTARPGSARCRARRSTSSASAFATGRPSAASST